MVESLKNSAEKGYHGKEENMNVIPTIEDQISACQAGYPTILKYWDDDKKILDKKDDEEFWKKLVLMRFDWTTELLNRNSGKWTPAKFGEFSDLMRAQ